MKSWLASTGWHRIVLFSLILLLATSCEFLVEVGNIVELLEWPGKIDEMRAEAIVLKDNLPDYPYSTPVPSQDTLMNWITEICETDHRRPGTLDGHQAETWVFNQFENLGLQNVTEEQIPISVWSPSQWSLSVEGQEIPSFFTVYTAFTGSAGITAPMVYVSEGSEEDFMGLDVSGKIAVADVTFGSSDPNLAEALQYFAADPYNQLPRQGERWNIGLRENFPGEFFGAPLFEEQDVYKRAVSKGAIGIALILKDQPSAVNSHYGPYDGVLKSIPGLWIGKYDGEILRSLAQQGKQANLKLQGTVEDGYMANTWGILPGESEDTILITSHQDSPHKGAVQDSSGIAQVLAQAWVWSQIPQQQRPKTLVFVAAAGHMYGGLGGYYFATSHPDIMAKTQTLLTLEHVAAKEVSEASDGSYQETGETNISAMFISHDLETVSATWKAVDDQPVNAISALPTFGFFPPTDASGFVYGSTGAELGEEAELTDGVTFVSWISDPYYLLDEEDTLDKIDQSQLVPSAKLVTELVKNYMMLN